MVCSLLQMGDALEDEMLDNSRVDDRDRERQEAPSALVEFVCIAKHTADTTSADGYSVTMRSQVAAYCARGADQNHEWVRVPATPVGEITIGRMEDRPPEPAYPRDRMARRA